MASGKGHSKGFHYYMSKKFFHPGNPINLEAVFIARQNHERAKREESEKMSEYQREQEAYEAKETLAIAKGKTQQERDKLSLSFMYDAPVGLRGTSFNTPTAVNETLTLKGKENEEGEPFCFRCSKGYHQPDRCPKDGEPLFEWQRGAPREGYLRADAQVSDKPFGIQVQMTRCLRCHEMGHSHTEKFCPMYGKARDHEEPEVMQPVDKKKLLAELRDKEGLAFNSFDMWDNGRNQKGKLRNKEYDLVFSSGEEATDKKDLLVDLVTKMKKKKLKKKLGLKNGIKKEKGLNSVDTKFKVKKEKDIKTEIEDWEEKGSKKSKKKKKKHKKEKRKEKKTSKEISLEREIKEIKQELDIKKELDSDDSCEPSPSKRRRKTENQVIDDIVIMDSEDETLVPAGRKLTSDTLAKIDEILYADIGKLQKMDKVDKVSSSFMSEVDKILSLGSSGGGNSSQKGDDNIAVTSEDENSEESEEGDDLRRRRNFVNNHEDDEDESYSDEVETEGEEEEELSEGEMRLLNMIKINKIDVKLNFPKAYSDTACHFCREAEDSEHLAQCPVYSTVMRGTEFEDIKSKDVARVKRALANIRAALEQRSKALSFTSVGDISRKNMQLLTLRETGVEDRLKGEKSKLVEQILEGS